MPLKRINIFFSTLNFALSFIGYQLATSLFLPVISNVDSASQAVTIPYRAFALAVSLIVIILNLRKNNQDKRNHPMLVMYWLFWLLFMVRVFYDTNFGIAINIYDKQKLWLYIIAICTVTMISVQCSFNKIDFNKAFWWILIGSSIAVLLSYFSNLQYANIMGQEEISRESGNLALNTISYGHLGVQNIILCTYALLRRKNNWIERSIILILIVLSTIAILRAGSRSPIVALFIVFFVWAISRGRNVGSIVLISTIIIIASYILLEPILTFISNISPLLEMRLRASIYEGDSSGRDIIYSQAWNAFVDSPWIGKSFALITPSGTDYYYAHNFILDALMGIGIFGGIAIISTTIYLLRKSIKSIGLDNTKDWICLIFVQQVVLSFFSGAFYQNLTLNVLIIAMMKIDFTTKRKTAMRSSAKTTIPPRKHAPSNLRKFSSWWRA